MAAVAPMLSGTAAAPIAPMAIEQAWSIAATYAALASSTATFAISRRVFAADATVRMGREPLL